MSYDTMNVFAKLLREEIPAIKVYEDDKTLAFMDMMPQSEGHVLVIPKEEARDIFELSEAGAAALINTVQRVARAVKAALGCQGLLLAQLNGEAAGQTIFHVHFHIIPRWHGIDLGVHAKNAVDPKILEPIAIKIRKVIRSE